MFVYQRVTEFPYLEMFIILSFKTWSFIVGHVHCKNHSWEINKQLCSHSKSWLNPCSHFQTDVHSHDMRKKNRHRTWWTRDMTWQKPEKWSQWNVEIPDKKNHGFVERGCFLLGDGISEDQWIEVIEVRENLFYWPMNHSMADQQHEIFPMVWCIPFPF